MGAEVSTIFGSPRALRLRSVMSPEATSSTLAGTCEPAHTKGLHLRWITTGSTAFRVARLSPKGEDKIAKMRMWRRVEMFHSDQSDQVKMTAKPHNKENLHWNESEKKIAPLPY